MLSTDCVDGAAAAAIDGSKEQEESKLPSDVSNVSWDETMFSAAFDSQIKLVQKSLGSPTELTGPSTPAAPKPARPSAKSKTKENKKDNKSESRPDRDSRYVVTHQSCKFRFEEDAPESTSTESNKKQPTSIKNDPKGQTTKASAAAAKSCMMPPPPPMDTGKFPDIQGEDEARASMLMSWYMAGYHTGYFEAMRKHKKSSE